MVVVLVLVEGGGWWLGGGKGGADVGKGEWGIPSAHWRDMSTPGCCIGDREGISGGRMDLDVEWAGLEGG